MDRLIIELEQLTERGLAALATMDSEQLTDFMDQRSGIIEALMKVTPTPKEKLAYRDRIQTVISYDAIFLSKLEKLRDEAAQQLSKLEAGKTQRSAYDHAYDTDSYFFDRKK